MSTPHEKSTSLLLSWSLSPRGYLINIFNLTKHKFSTFLLKVGPPHPLPLHPCPPDSLASICLLCLTWLLLHHRTCTYCASTRDAAGLVIPVSSGSPSAQWLFEKNAHSSWELSPESPLQGGSLGAAVSLRGSLEHSCSRHSFSVTVHADCDDFTHVYGQLN